MEQGKMNEAEVLGPRAEHLSTAGNVPVSQWDTGVAVVGKERWEEIARMRTSGQSVSQIARLTGLDRKTVRHCLGKTAWRPYQRAAALQTLMTEHQSWLVERAPQVQFSARILFQELRSIRGYRGGYDTVRNAVRPLRLEAAAQNLTQRRFETAPGQQAQADWGQTRVRFVTGWQVVHIFVMTLGYSRRGWAEGYQNERMGSLLAAHEHAFGHFGGHTAEILYDRMRTVTTGLSTGEGKPRWNPTFEAFARYWGFEPRLCRPYRAQTKGKVESGVKYIKRNFLPGRIFQDMADFNEQLAAWQAEVADVRIHGTTHERPIERFAREADALVRTLDQPSFHQAVPRQRIVAEDWLVSIDANRYSVPWRLIGKTVDVVRVGASWHICHQGRPVAEHLVLPGRHQLSVDPQHGPGAAARNARKRFSDHGGPPADPSPATRLEGVEVRDLAVYDQMLGLA